MKKGLYLLVSILVVLIGTFGVLAMTNNENFNSEGSFSYENSLYATMGLSESDYKELTKAHEKSLIEYPDRVVSYIVLGGVYSIGGEYTKAIDTYRKCIDLNPQDPMCYWAIFEVQLFSGLTIEQSLIKQFELQVSDSDSAFYQVRIDMALLFEKVSLFNEALTENEKEVFREKYAVTSELLETESYWLHIDHWVANQPDNERLLDTLAFFKSI